MSVIRTKGSGWVAAQVRDQVEAIANAVEERLVAEYLRGMEAARSAAMDGLRRAGFYSDAEKPDPPEEVGAFGADAETFVAPIATYGPEN